MSNTETILISLLDIVHQEIPEAEIKPFDYGVEKSIRVSIKAPYDPERPSKRFQPIIITLHEDFVTSEFSKRPFSEIRKKFTSFIKNKRAKFNPRTTQHANEPHTADYWVFPDEC